MIFQIYTKNLGKGSLNWAFWPKTENLSMSQPLGRTDTTMSNDHIPSNYDVYIRIVAYN